MTCMKAQSMITPFINDKLSLKETEEFIDHVNSCKDCREELEVYYALLTAMKQLDENKDLSEDYSADLNAKLYKAQEKIIHEKFTFYRKKGILFLIILLMGFIFSFEHSVRQNREETMVTDSDFHLRVTFHQERFDRLDTLLEQKYGEPVQK